MPQVLLRLPSDCGYWWRSQRVHVVTSWVTKDSHENKEGAKAGFNGVFGGGQRNQGKKKKDDLNRRRGLLVDFEGSLKNTN